MVEVLRQYFQRIGIGHAHGHAIGQPRADRGFDHMAGRERVGVGGGEIAHHADDARPVAQRQLGGNR